MQSFFLPTLHLVCQDKYDGQVNYYYSYFFVLLFFLFVIAHTHEWMPKFAARRVTRYFKVAITELSALGSFYNGDI
jgi:hypothetical protein